MKSSLSLILTLLSLSGCSKGWKESPQVAEVFQRAGVQGTFVLYDVSSGTFTGHNRARAEQRFVPASTFKIANSLIGLSVGAVKDVEEALPYGGGPTYVPEWGRDMGLREAIALSNVPIYQELARRIGLERMREQVARLGYGNGEIGSVVDSFWLEGPLAISAVEQAQFLARLAQGTLPFPAQVQKSVRRIVLLEHRGDWALFGKTGWENAPGAGVGWWVGWVEKEGRIHTFALNVDIRQPEDAKKRLEIGKACLAALGVL